MSLFAFNKRILVTIYLQIYNYFLSGDWRSPEMYCYLQKEIKRERVNLKNLKYFLA